MNRESMYIACLDLWLDTISVGEIEVGAGRPCLHSITVILIKYHITEQTIPALFTFQDRIVRKNNITDSSGNSEMHRSV